jgi:hypothetical protein
VLNAFAEIKRILKDSAAAQTSGYDKALSQLSHVLPLITVKISETGNDAGRYYPLYSKLVLPRSYDNYTVVHEMVHAWNHQRSNGIRTDRGDEGMVGVKVFL